MKTYIIVNHKEFSGIIPESLNHQGLMFPVANKPLIAHWVDFAIHCGSRDIYILSEKPLDKMILDWFGDGNRLGVNLTFRAVSPHTMDMDQALAKIHTDKDTRYMIIKGYFFIHYDKKQDYAGHIACLPSGELAVCPTGRITVFGPRASDCSDPEEGAQIQLLPIVTLEDLFQLSIRTLGEYEDRFFLPGYSQENGVIVGKDSVIDPSARLVPPVMIGDHVRIHAQASVGPHAVVGNHVVIDSHSELRETVVLDKTYIGSHLTLSRKLAKGSTLIDPLGNNVIQLEEPQLLSSMEVVEGHEGPSGFWASLRLRFKKLFSRTSDNRKNELSSKTA